MRSAATIETGNVIVIVSPSAIFPLDGSITTPPESGFAFELSSSWAKLVPAMAIARTQTRKGMKRRIRRSPVFSLRRVILIIFVAPVLGSGGDRHQLRL